MAAVVADARGWTDAFVCTTRSHLMPPEPAPITPATLSAPSQPVEDSLSSAATR